MRNIILNAERAPNTDAHLAKVALGVVLETRYRRLALSGWFPHCPRALWPFPGAIFVRVLGFGVQNRSRQFFVHDLYTGNVILGILGNLAIPVWPKSFRSGLCITSSAR